MMNAKRSIGHKSKYQFYTAFKLDMTKNVSDMWYVRWKMHQQNNLHRAV